MNTSKIIVVEDEVLVADELKSRIENFGYSVDDLDQEEIQHRYSKNEKHFRLFKIN